MATYSIRYKSLFQIVTSDTADIVDVPGAPFPMKASPRKEYFRIYPTYECEALLRKFDLVYRSAPSGASVLFRSVVVDGLEKVRTKITSRARFVFVVYLEDREIFQRFPNNFVVSSESNIHLHNLATTNVLNLTGTVGSIEKYTSLASGKELNRDNGMTLVSAGKGNPMLFARYVGNTAADGRYNLSNRFRDETPFAIAEIFVDKDQNSLNSLMYEIPLY